MIETPTKTVHKDGTVIYKDSAGNLHSEDGPAVEGVGGYKAWFLHGKWHRENGPAITYANDTKEWFLHGEYHREDGPAIEYANGDKYWYLHGVKVDRETYEHVRICPLEELPEYIGTEYDVLVMKRLAAA